MSAVTDLAAPAARLKKPSWKDPRLLIGILLVLVSVASVTALLGNADKTVEMFAARDDISVGQKITSDEFSIVNVSLGEVEHTYLSAETGIPENAVATTFIRKGELIPGASLGTADALDRKPVALTIDSALPEGAGAGARVDVWVAMPDGRNGFSPPERLLESAEISQLTETGPALGSVQIEQLHVLVTDEKMPGLLNALSNGARINVVLNPGSGS